ncbi:MAG: hypothetical protein ACFFAU_01100 [Candidatus Hodarchaeota archaeon]
MDYLKKEKEQEEIQELLKQEVEEEQDPDFIQYGFLKWKTS